MIFESDVDYNKRIEVFPLTACYYSNCRNGNWLCIMKIKVIWLKKMKQKWNN